MSGSIDCPDSVEDEPVEELAELGGPADAIVPVLRRAMACECDFWRKRVGA